MKPSDNLQSPFILNAVLEKSHVYRFRSKITLFLKNKKDLSDFFTRDVEITFLGKIRNLYVYNLFTQKTAISSHQSVENEQLQNAAIAAFNDIIAGINDKGEIIKIYNHNEMQKKWTHRKQKLQEDLIGLEFTTFAGNVTAVLKSQEKIIYNLNKPHMFGLFFHGLFDQINQQEPITRKKTLLDFDGTEITEEIRVNKSIPEFSISAKKSNDENKKILSTKTDLTTYSGSITYGSESQLLEANLNIKSNNKHINYNIVWAG